MSLCAMLHFGFAKMAEREGFEPPEPCGSAVFKTAAIDHSATSPCCVAGDKFCEMPHLSSFLLFLGVILTETLGSDSLVERVYQFMAW